MKTRSRSAWIHEQSSGLVFGRLPKPLQWLFDIDFGAIRGAVPAYTLPNHRTTAWLRDTVAKTGPWRCLGLLSNGFVEEGPCGVGEPPIGPVAAAIGNATFNATGMRLRRLPMTPERVLGA